MDTEHLACTKFLHHHLPCDWPQQRLCFCGYSASFTNKLLLVLPWLHVWSPPFRSHPAPQGGKVALTPLCSLPGLLPNLVPSWAEDRAPGHSSPTGPPWARHPGAEWGSPSPQCTGPQSRRCLRPQPAPLACSRPGWVLCGICIVLFRQTGAKQCGESPQGVL